MAVPQVWKLPVQLLKWDVTPSCWKKKETLGGLAAEISKIPAKKRLADFPHYLEHRAAALDNLYIFTGTQATPENIRKFHPNLIVNATGSGPLLPPIKGLMDNIDKEGGNVYSILGMINHINDYPEDLDRQEDCCYGRRCRRS